MISRAIIQIMNIFCQRQGLPYAKGGFFCNHIKNSAIPPKYNKAWPIKLTNLIDFPIAMI